MTELEHEGTRKIRVVVEPAVEPPEAPQAPTYAPLKPRPFQKAKLKGSQHPFALSNARRG